MNTREIYKQSWRLSTTEPKALGVFVLHLLMIMLVSAITSFIPLIGGFLSSFLAIVLNGYLMVNLEHTLIKRDDKKLAFSDIKLKKYISPFINLIIATIFISIIFTLTIFATLKPIFSQMDTITGSYFTSVLVTLAVTALPIILLACLFSIILALIMSYIVLPKVYIATKFNDYERDSLNEIYQIFKENSLLKRSIKLELLLGIEFIAISAVLIATSSISIVIFIIVGSIYSILSSIKMIIARTLLYNDLCESVLIED